MWATTAHATPLLSIPYGMITCTRSHTVGHLPVSSGQLAMMRSFVASFKSAILMYSPFFA